MILRGTTPRRLLRAAWLCVLGLGAGSQLFLPGPAVSEDSSAAKQKPPEAITVEDGVPVPGADAKPPRGTDGERRLAERLANVERRLQQLTDALERLEKKLSDEGAPPPRPAETSPRYKGKALQEWMRDLGDRDPETAIRATQAVAAIGTGALPALADDNRFFRQSLLSTAKSNSRWSPAALAGKQPAPWQPRRRLRPRGTPEAGKQSALSLLPQFRKKSPEKHKK